jgi:hypothetical protein
MRKKIKRPATNKAIELVLKKLHSYTIDIAIQMLEQSIVGSWQGVFELKKSKQSSKEADDKFHELHEKIREQEKNGK